MFCDTGDTHIIRDVFRYVKPTDKTGSIERNGSYHFKVIFKILYISEEK